jgi:hypothetical protein
VRLTDRKDGSTELEAAARLSASIQRFNLATDLRYRRQYASSGPSPPRELNLDLIGAGRAGEVRLRGYTSFDLAQRALRSAELSAYWSASERSDWEGALAFDTQSKRGRARMTHIRRLNSVAVAVTGEAASDGSLAVGLNLNFSLDARRGLRFSRQPLAGAGAIDARVYRDLNDNGFRDPSEPFEKGALITAGSRLSDTPTDSKGSVMVGGLATFSPVTVGVDETSLPDPTLVPRKALQVVVPRPGVPAEVLIGLVGGGDIEGALIKSGGLGFEGLDLELVDSDGKLIGTTRTDFDGFFLFERVPYGRYSLRLAKQSAEAAGVAQQLSVQAVVSSDKPTVRLGGVHVRPLPQIASAL